MRKKEELTSTLDCQLLISKIQLTQPLQPGDILQINALQGL